MLGYINQMVSQVEGYNDRFASYDEIDLTSHEDIFMRWYYQVKGMKGMKGFETPGGYWKKQLDFKR